MPEHFKVIDKRGNNKQAASLYPTPRNYIQNFKPRFYNVTDTPKAVTKGDRTDQIKYGRELFATCGNIGSAVINKNTWAVAQGWLPIFNCKNKAWGDMVEDWLINKWFPRCNTLGYNYSFATTLYLSGIALDVDGDTGMTFTVDRNTGMPLIQLVPSHRIGHRFVGNKVIGGKYDGYDIWDGVVVNSNNVPIAYSILGDTEEDDIILSARSIQLLYEPEWQDQYRGISRLARSLFDILDIADTDELEKRAVKLAATIGLIHSTESGQPDEGAILVGVEEDVLGQTPYPTRPPFEMMSSGEVLYTKAGAGEDIKSFLSDRPSPNTEAFVARIERRIFSAIGYPYELSDPSKVGGASVRLIQDIARQSISTRQTTIERRARLAVQYAISVAMDNDIIPRNDDDDWNNFKFTKPAKLTVDNGYEQQALREGFKLGITSFSTISGQNGEDWYELRNQVQKETEDLLNRATIIANKYNITLDAALNLLSQRTPNAAPVAQIDNSTNK